MTILTVGVTPGGTLWVISDDTVRTLQTILPQVPSFVPPFSLQLRPPPNSFNRISVFNEDFRASDEEAYKYLEISSPNELGCTSRLASMSNAGMMRKWSTKLGEVKWTRSLLSRSRTCLRLSRSQANPESTSDTPSVSSDWTRTTHLQVAS